MGKQSKETQPLASKKTVPVAHMVKTQPCSGKKPSQMNTNK